MPTEELRELRLKYKAAYTGYMASVHALSELAKRGEKPPREILDREMVALRALTNARRLLIDALVEAAPNGAKNSN